MSRNDWLIIAGALIAIFAVVLLMQNVGPETVSETSPPVLPPAATGTGTGADAQPDGAPAPATPSPAPR